MQTKPTRKPTILQVNATRTTQGQGLPVRHSAARADRSHGLAAKPATSQSRLAGSTDALCNSCCMPSACRAAVHRTASQPSRSACSPRQARSASSACPAMVLTVSQYWREANADLQVCNALCNWLKSGFAHQADGDVSHPSAAAARHVATTNAVPAFMKYERRICVTPPTFGSPRGPQPRWARCVAQ